MTTSHLTPEDVARVYTATAAANGNVIAFVDAALDKQRIALLMGLLLNHHRATHSEVDPDPMQLAAATMDAAFRRGYARQPWLADDDEDGHIVRNAAVRTAAEKTYALLAEALLAYSTAGGAA